MKIGVLGSGQLGQMMCLEALPLGYDFYCYSPDKESPSAKAGAIATVASYESLSEIKEFLSKVNVLSFEFENIPKATLEFLESESKQTPIFPPPKALIIAQDRSLEKTHFRKLGFRTADFFHLTKDTSKFEIAIPFPWIIKTLRFGYDGKGQVKIKDEVAYKSFLETAFSKKEEEYLVEEVISFQKEISIILTRFQNGEIVCYGAVENEHKNHILDLSIYPAKIPTGLNLDAIEMASKLADSLDYVGTLGVEFFLKDNHLYLNEFAPRPHNTGHFTQDCQSLSQFNLHVSAITGNLPPTDVRPKPTLMKNILGNEFEESLFIARSLLKDDRYQLHLYGKKDAKIGRKMGHMNFRGSLEEVNPLFHDL
ncbi:5-(carboxyamino)imidazole ribonucleotide synthase [Leptospira congkakensis]|uniref:N5-carboxyaminoimidazole ribonucleotide synthase n=1 Tax=Leptospira congkakensis TaxID=2484932 RepID=A0A4Z1AD63_9LEPT|nr:5-(carboxyamino)imidazole ribonucleotide synthase [Leptospira congkakensis]TGL90474.1 5-(carboxyamino)imidazole ribonucleotide synthase [Leptospira congkakensis]TGL91481.1 5-(carboxyamino)imidazole ribonucleotide synthase [Leptospira congkakensis]TGL98533.1 5-(carboxyamino)imidazole ribonucleotide synthase [Leptospira congkakensis]